MADISLYDGITLRVIVPAAPKVMKAVLPSVPVLRVVPAFGPKGDPGDSGGGQVSSVNGRIGDVVGLAEASDIPDVSEFVTADALDDDLVALATFVNQKFGPVNDSLDQINDALPTFATTVALTAVQAQIPDVSGFATETDLQDVAASIPSISGLATSAQVVTDIAAASTADRNRVNHTGTQLASTISDFNAAADLRIGAQKAQPFGLATLGADGTIPPSQVSTLVTTQIYPDVADIAAMLGLPADSPGDQAFLPDATWAYLGPAVGPPTALSSWRQLPAPLGGVITVNSRSGNVTGLAEQSALNAVSAALSAHTTDYGNPHFTTTSQINEDTPYKRFTNEGDITRLSNTSGVNTGDQDLSGLVRGPGVATDNAVARFDLTTGKLIQSSVLTVSDTGEIRTNALNAAGGSTGAAIAIPAGRAARGIVLQQTLAAGTLNQLEGQRSDGGTTWRFDAAGSLRFQGNTDQSIVVTTDGATKSSSNAKTQFQAANAGSTAVAVYGFGTQTADFFRILTDAGILLFAVGADAKLLWGPNGAQDVNLYRGGNNILATDDAFSAAGPVTGSNLSGTNTGDKQQVVDARSNIGAARPSHTDPVIWRVTSGATPTNINATLGDFTVSDA